MATDAFHRLETLEDLLTMEREVRPLRQDWKNIDPVLISWRLIDSNWYKILRRQSKITILLCHDMSRLEVSKDAINWHTDQTATSRQSLNYGASGTVTLAPSRSFSLGIETWSLTRGFWEPPIHYGSLALGEKSSVGCRIIEAAPQVRG